MGMVMSAIGTPLGYIMWACYNLVNNYGLAIILFTLVTKLLLFPVAVKIQKNSVKMVKIRPMIENLKKQYPNKEDKEAFMDAQMELYAQEKYNPVAGCLPLLIQLPIIFGLIDVIYKPLKHLLHLPARVIDVLESKTLECLQTNDLGVTAQLKVIEAVNNSQFQESFHSITNVNGIDSIITRIQNINLSFFGLDLSGVPSIFNPGILLIIPALSGLSSLILSVLQNRGGNVLQAEQGKKSQLGMTIFLTAFSLYFAFLVPAGIGIYWIMSNIFAISQMYLLNKIYDPAEYIDYEAIEKIKQEKREQKQNKKGENKTGNGVSPGKRERQDYKRFFRADNKQLVFYSEKSGYYKYYEDVIDELLKRSDIVIHYVTSDPGDAIYNKDNPQIVPYYIGGNRLIPFMMKMNADLVVMTMPDLGQMHIKRSLVRDDVEYIYLCHGVLSTHMVLRKGALDYYDTIFCVGPHQIEEIRETEKIYHLKPKNLMPCGYGIVETMKRDYLRIRKTTTPSDKKKILIAPSWQKDNILDSCLEDLLSGIIRKGYKITLRPHPEYIKRYKDRMADIFNKYQRFVNEDFIIETDFISSSSILEADVLITDWSNVAYEFAYVTGKPPIFINTPMKVMNPEYTLLSSIPLDISLRNEIGRALEINDVKDIEENIAILLTNHEEYEKKIEEVADKYLFRFGNSGAIMADYILSRLKKG